MLETRNTEDTTRRHSRPRVPDQQRHPDSPRLPGEHSQQILDAAAPTHGPLDTTCALVSQAPPLEPLSGALPPLPALLALLPDAFVLTDANGVIHASTPAVTALACMGRSHMMGKPITVLVHPAVRQALAARLTALRQARTPRVQSWTLQLRGRGATEGPQVRVRVLPVFNQHGAPPAFHWLLRDVTVEHQLQAELSRLQASQMTALRDHTAELTALLHLRDLQLAALRADYATR